MTNVNVSNKLAQDRMLQHGREFRELAHKLVSRDSLGSENSVEDINRLNGLVTRYMLEKQRYEYEQYVEGCTEIEVVLHAVESWAIINEKFCTAEGVPYTPQDEPDAGFDFGDAIVDADYTLRQNVALVMTCFTLGRTEFLKITSRSFYPWRHSDGTSIRADVREAVWELVQECQLCGVCSGKGCDYCDDTGLVHGAT